MFSSYKSHRESLARHRISEGGHAIAVHLQRLIAIFYNRNDNRVRNALGNVGANFVVAATKVDLCSVREDKIAKFYLLTSRIFNR